MSEEQKVWFVYLTDHHEGPFSFQEVAEKHAQGLVSAQTLAWKDGMPEWVAIESIPELVGALAPTNAPVAAAGESSAPVPAASAPADDSPSLAQLLAASQGGGTEPALEVSAAPLAANELPASATPAQEPSEQDVVWTLRNGNEVSGLFSYAQLKDKAKNGQVSEQAMLWHSGWADFRPLSEFADLAQLAKSAPKTKTTITTKTLVTGKTKAPIVNDDEATDTEITAPKKSFLGKLKSLFAKKAKTPAAAKPVKAAKPKSKLMPVIGLVVLLAGAGAVYFFLFMGPIPSSLDVRQEDREAMNAAVKAPKEQGQLYMATAIGTEDNIADPSNPKYYVATNLPEGSQVQLLMKGIPGTLVNATTLEKQFTGTVGKDHYAVFENFKDDNGKPLPMGEYTLTLSADNAKLQKKIFFGGLKGPAYERRLAQFKEKMQKEYDDEMQFLRETINTLKSGVAALSAQLADYRANESKPPQKARLQRAWSTLSATTKPYISQLMQKLNERMNAPGERFQPTMFKDALTVCDQIQKLLDAQASRLEGGLSKPEELEGLIQAGIVSLEQTLAQNVVKSPLEATQGTTSAPAPAKQ